MAPLAAFPHGDTQQEGGDLDLELRLGVRAKDGDRGMTTEREAGGEINR